MERNNAYWGKKPDWEKVSFRFLTAAPTRVAAILAGDVDVIEGVPPSDMARLKSNANLSVVEELSNRVIYFHLDHFREVSPFITAKDGSQIKNPLRDLRVRQALSMAMNRQAIVDRIMEGQASSRRTGAAIELLRHLQDAEADPVRSGRCAQAARRCRLPQRLQDEDARPERPLHQRHQDP
jgi:ABC-type transport system substrate-binding protein